MKMIQPGNTMGGVWTAKAACTGKGNGDNGCGAELEVSGDDLFRTYASYMGRDEDHFVTFMCPGCGVYTDVWDTKGHRNPNFGNIKSYNDFPKCNKQQRDEAARLLRDGTYTPPHKVSIVTYSAAKPAGDNG